MATQRIFNEIVYAIISGNVDACDYYFNPQRRNRNEIIDINTVDNAGDTLLIIAVSLNKTDIVRGFIEKGANVNMINRQRKTAMCVSALNRNYEIMNILMRAGANPDIGDNKPIYMCTNNYINNIMMNIPSQNDFNAIRSLIEYGADPNSINYQDETALTLACKSFDLDRLNCMPVIEMLIDAGGRDSYRNPIKYLNRIRDITILQLLEPEITFDDINRQLRIQDNPNKYFLDAKYAYMVRELNESLSSRGLGDITPRVAGFLSNRFGRKRR